VIFCGGYPTYAKPMSSGKLLLATGDAEKKRDFLRKIGSNFQVAEKRLSVELKNAWKIVAEFNSAPPLSHAACGEKPKISVWRRGGDSNPRYGLTRTTV
jgi:hypothetical protein